MKIGASILWFQYSLKYAAVNLHVMMVEHRPEVEHASVKY